jgi:hypothetical protein
VGGQIVPVRPIKPRTLQVGGVSELGHGDFAHDDLRAMTASQRRRGTRIETIDSRFRLVGRGVGGVGRGVSDRVGDDPRFLHPFVAEMASRCKCGELLVSDGGLQHMLSTASALR